MSKWSRDAVEALIKVYKANPCLYDVKSELYHKQHLRDAAVNEMMESVKKFRLTVTAKECIAKYKIVRQQYMKELRKLEACKYMEKPTLWCFEALSFLNDYRYKKERSFFNAPVCHEGTEENEPSECDDEDYPVECLEADYSCTTNDDDDEFDIYAQREPSTSGTKRKLVETLEEDEQSIEKKKKKMQEILEYTGRKKNTTPSNEFHNNSMILRNNIQKKPDKEDKSYFGHFIQEQLNMIKSKKNKLMCIKDIQDVLYEYQMKELTDDDDDD